MSKIIDNIATGLAYQLDQFIRASLIRVYNPFTIDLYLDALKTLPETRIELSHNTQGDLRLTIFFKENLIGSAIFRSIWHEPSNSFIFEVLEPMLLT